MGRTNLPIRDLRLLNTLKQLQKLKNHQFICNLLLHIMSNK